MKTDTTLVKTWRQKLSAFALAIAILVLFATILTTGWSNMELKMAMEETIGRQIVIGSDTLTITGYHTGRRVIKLSNGTEADMKLIPILGLVPIGREKTNLD